MKKIRASVDKTHQEHKPGYHILYRDMPPELGLGQGNKMGSCIVCGCHVFANVDCLVETPFDEQGACGIFKVYHGHCYASKPDRVPVAKWGVVERGRKYDPNRKDDIVQPAQSAESVQEPLDVAIYLLEPKYFNAAAAKVSTYHKQRGDHVELYNHLKRQEYNKIYAFSIFKDTPKNYVTPKMICGGTGFNLTSRLPDEIEACDYDYSLFPHINFSWQIFSRGCINGPEKCPFCVVPLTEGRIRPVELKNWNDKDEYVVVACNSFFGNKKWRRAIEILKEHGKPVDFLGVDARILTDEMCHALLSLRHHKQIHIAWDNPRVDLVPKLQEITKIIKPRKLMCYVLIGYWSTPEEDMARFNALRDLKIDPFPMHYKDYYGRKDYDVWVKQLTARGIEPTMTEAEYNRYVIDFCRWGDQPRLNKKVKWEDYDPNFSFEKWRKEKPDLVEQPMDAADAVEMLQQNTDETTTMHGLESVSKEDVKALSVQPDACRENGSQTLTLGSLFDGIGGFPLAASRCGITPVWMSEKDEKCNKVTAHHFPDIEQLGDITKLDGRKLKPVNIITAGFPCQDFSVAGKREGLKGERSSLFHDAMRIIREMKDETKGQYPKICLLENVPGLLNSNKGEDFRAVISEIVGVQMPLPEAGKWTSAGVVEWDSGSLAWGIKDAQYFGVPQRRRRVFIVINLRGYGAGEILFEPAGLPGNTPKGGEAGLEVARPLVSSSHRKDCADREQYVVAGFNAKNSASMGGVEYLEELSPTVSPSRAASVAGTGVARCVTAGEGERYDSESCNLIVSPTLRSNWRNNSNPATEASMLVYGIKNTSINVADHNGPDGSGYIENTMYPLTSTRGPHAVAVDARHSKESNVNGSLQAPNNNQLVRQNMAVRRLTPTECERLMGFPDGWTAINGISNSSRYRMLGNSVAVPVVEWIMHRIAAALEKPATIQTEPEPEKKRIRKQNKSMAVEAAPVVKPVSPVMKKPRPVDRGKPVTEKDIQDVVKTYGKYGIEKAVAKARKLAGLPAGQRTLWDYPQEA